MTRNVGVLGIAVLVAAFGCGSNDDAKEEDGEEAADAGSEEPEEKLPAAIADDCITDVTAGAHDFGCGGLKFRLTVPAACLEHACGVILDVHGWFMTGEQEDKETGLSARGAERGYFTIHPTANLMPPRLPGNTTPEPSWDQEADSPILHDFVKRAIAAFHADEKRIHVTGFSQGGMMTGTLLCHDPGLWASVAPAGASVPACDGDEVPEVPMIYMHGTRDALVPFSVATGSRDHALERLGMGEGAVLSTDDMHTWTRYENERGTVFEFIEHDYASTLSFVRGHCYPGSTSRSILACKGAAAFSWGQAVIDFLAAHPKL